MERYGLVTREVVPATPPQVTYGLTALGSSFLVTVGGICRWTIENMYDIEGAITAFDTRGEESAEAARPQHEPDESSMLEGRSPADHAFADLVMAQSVGAAG
jgi:hypothetical protein